MTFDHASAAKAVDYKCFVWSGLAIQICEDSHQQQNGGYGSPGND